MSESINYVKFLRGTPSAFSRLPYKDSNTLYFISEKGEDKGALYLGAKLIAGTSNLNASSIEELMDVEYKLPILNGEVLSYDGLSEKWTNKTIDAISEKPMEGASEDKDGVSGLTPAPKRGEQNFYLKGDGTWAPNLDSEQLKTIVGEDGGKSMREVSFEEVNKIVADAPESYNTLGKIADWIKAHSEEVTTINSTISSLQKGLLATSQRVDSLEKLLTWESYNI